ncbi:type II toxin-antitoxin system Phd/YefM family antitoxin [Mesorhizobium sp. M7A.F.Ca.MR.176.00.0.0]|uniref:type II toxin-antitoxin system Phd/YefM family antitoxin n=1 Tax=Mesorhizobium sp. M7A.F.Ca.MR.176.00.0.0 TaxID=2496776 RepID=UPI000FD3930D|nr:type II toxin-antitoxin system prevent-host-death family antitoxin [Mesorhizobium sp. M7A.F.Ca.MR.176.00.0.0]RUU87411.1 type II toxin-antitoxin system Phd/YefM family antitoxin [Mesorhizobium sp. M7A.F.Ca.MR.176.00.0.0]
MTRTVNIRDAKAHLSRLVRRAAQGESFVIAKSGKPLARIVPIEQPALQARRVGFMEGQFSVPDDFDRMGRNEIEQRFDAGL